MIGKCSWCNDDYCIECADRNNRVDFCSESCSKNWKADMDIVHATEIRKEQRLEDD